MAAVAGLGWEVGVAWQMAAVDGAGVAVPVVMVDSVMAEGVVMAVVDSVTAVGVVMVVGVVTAVAVAVGVVTAAAVAVEVDLAVAVA